MSGDILTLAKSIRESKENIRQAIVTKGVECDTTVALADYPEKINSISTGGSTLFGVPLEAYAGTFDSSTGRYSAYSGTITPDFTGLKTVSGNVMMYKFTGAKVGNITFPDFQQDYYFDFEGAFTESTITSINFPAMTSINFGNMQKMCQTCNSLEKIDFPVLTSVVGFYVFQDFAPYSRNKLTSINFPELVTVGAADKQYSEIFNGAFRECTSLPSASFPKLTTIYTNDFVMAFWGCSSLAEISFPVLNKIGDSCFSSAFCQTALTSVTFPKLADMGEFAFSYAFESCTKLTSLSFPALKSTSFGDYTDQFNDMLSGVTGCTVHFPSNLESVIGSWSDVTAGFGGTNTTVLYDLDATE